MMATLFHNPMDLTKAEVLWLVIPLCLSVVIVYKTVRTESLRRLPLQVLMLAGYVVVGLAVLGASLYVIQQYWP